MGNTRCSRVAIWLRSYLVRGKSLILEGRPARYLRSRIRITSRDVEHGLEVTLSHFTACEPQNRALEIPQIKLGILWSISDAIPMRCGLSYG